MTLEEKKAIISNTLVEEREMRCIVDTASELIGNPIFVMDLSMKFITFSSVIPAGCQNWEDFMFDGESEDQNARTVEKVRMIENAGIYNHILHSDEPIFGKFDFCPKRFLGCRIRDKSKAVAMACMVEDHPIGNEEIELMIHLCKTLLYQILYTGRTISQENPVCGLIQDLIEQKISSSEAQTRAECIHMKIPEKMRLILLSYEDGKLGLTLYSLQKTLSALLPLDHVILYKEDILILIDESRLHSDTMQMIRRNIAGIPVQAGVSRTSETLLSLHQAYSEAAAAIKIARKYNMDKICFYNDIALYHFFETTSMYTDILSFCSPVIHGLEEYDDEHNVSYLETLAAYLESGRNMQKAAEKLYIHRSSLHTRLRRMEELFDLDLHDENECFYLQLSLRIYSICEQQASDKCRK
ncbi:MAG: helix-turn-helix domain-containing protein [Eubacteriales bacterium]|nr:helix-turn-helix domain-containing protein [Eubacteriales bacterium]